MDKNTFTLTLTTAELLCAANALGIAALPANIAGDTPLTGERLQAEISKGHASLQKRQLVHSLSPIQWQIDNLLAILLHWLAAPDYLLQLDSWQQSGEQQAETIYFWQTAAVWRYSTADKHQFTFFEDGESWLGYALAKIAPVIKPATEASFSLPRMNLAEFLTQVQQKPVDIASMSRLQQAGLSPERSQEIVAKLALVTKVTTLTWQNSEAEVSRRVVFLNAPTATWSGEEESGKTFVWLQAINQENLVNFLSPTSASPIRERP